MSAHPSSADLVGVVVPTFNRRELLREALESVRGQTHERLEVLVMDNGSSDGTDDLMRGIRDARVRHVVNPRNLGLAGSIDAGVGLFSSAVEWCCVVCDDDLLDPSFVQEALTRASESRASAVVSGHRVFIDAAGKMIRDALPAIGEESAVAYLGARLRVQRETYLTGLLFDRRAFKAIGGYPKFTTGLASDDALIFALAMSDRLVHAPRAIARIRFHAGAESRSAKDALAKLETVDEFCGSCLRAADARKLSDAERAELERTLALYRRGLRSYWWQIAMRAVAESPDQSASPTVARLRALVATEPSSFWPLIRLSAWIQRNTRIDLERSPRYHAAVRRLQEVVNALRGLPKER
jgi:glycosyltransferase involved in cell wall biosynthesis